MFAWWDDMQFFCVFSHKIALLTDVPQSTEGDCFYIITVQIKRQFYHEAIESLAIVCSLFVKNHLK
ncbi:MAG: hypothetical protein ACJA0C_000332 [Candidatus Endobugula sp.]|jgi:hypothetical protein